jgi:hypothetical protein
MIQSGHGTVLYNKDRLRLCCVARSDRVDYKICESDGTVINNGTLNMCAEVIDGYFIYFSEIAVTLFTPNTYYYVTYWYTDSLVLREQVVIFNAFIYKPNLVQQYNDYPYIGNWITQTELDKTESNINSNTDTRATEIKEKIETTYLGNKKVEMAYCTEVPDPNPRNLFIGCADYIKETIRLPGAKSWTSPVSEIIMYYYYDEDGKQIQVNGD